MKTEANSLDRDKVLQFRIVGLDCMDEVSTLRQHLEPVVGEPHLLSFDLLNNRLTVKTDGRMVTESAIIAAVAKTGMRAEPWTGEKLSGGVAGATRNQNFFWMSLSGAFLFIAIFLSAALAWNLLSGVGIEVTQRFFLVCSVLCGLRLVVPKALRAGVRLRPDMNLLMFIAVIGALIIGEFFEAASVAFLFALAESLETWSVRHAHRAISALMDLTPPTARLVGINEMQPLEAIPVGAKIIVKPGERIPLDGNVIGGDSYVNQAPITGESSPIGKKMGDGVFAGTINGNGALEIETTKLAGDTTVAHILRLVEEAQSKRSASEQWVEKFARYYTPAVMLLAVFTFLLPPLLFRLTWSDWFYRSLVLLVVACPCALVISTPVSIVAALAVAARHGVLIKGGTLVELPAKIRAFALDKTGTLTIGNPEVKKIIPLNGNSDNSLLERAAALEIHSSHPLALAILNQAKKSKVAIFPAENLQESPGRGVSGHLKGEEVWVGSVRLLRERGQETVELKNHVDHLADQGHTIVVVGNHLHVCGLLAISDTIRPNAKSALADLRKLGVKKLVMLTGDTAQTALEIGREVGFDEVRGELLPDEKLKAVEELIQEYQFVAMVGDGINDAPALAISSLGIAMGAAGSDAAIETADIALMANDLTKLPWLFNLSNQTVRVIKQNIYFSLLSKAFFFGLTLVGYSSLWLAILADTGVSILVIFNSLRLLRVSSMFSPP
jgi:Cd2+/Zn2+-exporting ATPase